MRPLIFARATYLKKYLDLLRDIGLPVSPALRQFNLPAEIDERTDCYVPVVNALGFLRRMEWESEADLGCLVAARLSLSDFHEQVSRRIATAPTLFAALESLCALCYWENTLARIWMVSDGRNVKVRSTIGITGAAAGLHFSEWIQNQLVILIVRLFSSAAWQPPELGFQSLLRPNETVREHFPHTRVSTGQDSAFVVVPRSLLNSPQPGSGPAAAPGIDAAGPPSVLPDARPSFTSSLKLLLRGYIAADSGLSLHRTADIAGLSARNLQRQLALAGLTYRELLAEARFEVAVRLMQDPDAKIIDIAYATGYDDPSHFTRSFRRFTGVSPREYRALRSLNSEPNRAVPPNMLEDAAQAAETTHFIS